MRILVDESLPVELADELNLPSLKTVSQIGLKGLKNGALLQRAEALGFTVFLTADQNLEFQQDLSGHVLSVIVLRARSNRMEHLRPLIPAVIQGLTLIGPGQILRLGT